MSLSFSSQSARPQLLEFLFCLFRTGGHLFLNNNNDLPYHKQELYFIIQSNVRGILTRENVFMMRNHLCVILNTGLNSGSSLFQDPTSSMLKSLTLSIVLHPSLIC